MATNKHLRLLTVSSDAPSMAGFSFDPDLAPDYHVLVPSRLLRSPDFTPVAKVLYGLLLYYAGTGTSHLPALEVLAEECAVSQEQVEDAIAALISAGLLSYREAAPGCQAHYHLCTVPIGWPGSRPNRGCTKQANTHIPLEQPHTKGKQIEQDVRLLVEKVGVSNKAARSLSHLAADRGCYVGYVAEVVEYALNTPGIKNPAGCAVELIKRNERRRPVAQVQQPSQETRPTLDPEKYTTGKYAFLFRPRPAGEKQPYPDGAEEEEKQGGE